MPNPFDILPRGVRNHPSLHLRTWQPSGLLDAKRAGEILRFVEMEEKFEKPFNRFVDLSALSAVRLSMADIEELAAQRYESYHGGSVKSAIVALNPLSFGMARMYQQLMRRTPIEVRVFCRLTSAATWLNVPLEVLASK